MFFPYRSRGGSVAPVGKVKRVDDGYVGGYGVNWDRLFEGEDFDIVGKCIFIYYNAILQ